MTTTGRFVLRITGYLPERDVFNLTKSYVKCFSLPPWCESWTEAEARQAILGTPQRQTYLLVDYYTEMTETAVKHVVGAAIVLPVAHHPDLATFLERGVPSHALWLTDVFIDPDFQGRGLGRFLVEQAVLSAKLAALPLASRTLKVEEDSPFRMPRIFRSAGFDSIGEATFATGGVESVREIYLCQ